MRKCTKCGCEKPATTEYFYSDRSRQCGLTSSCKQCQREADAVRRAEGRKRNVERTPTNIKRAAAYMLKHKHKRKKQLWDLQMSVGCQACGYCRCPQALDFHHKDPLQKEYAVSQMSGRSVESIRDELCKCIVLCSNCHDEVHAGLLCVDELQTISQQLAQQHVV